MPKPQRPRRRKEPGPDHIKHRRTRSGCYTCRSRRVKCDEARPICKRMGDHSTRVDRASLWLLNLHTGCRKGSRECCYPEPKAQSPKDFEANPQGSPTSSNEYEDDAGSDTRLPTIPDEDEGSASGSQWSRTPRRNLRRINTSSSLNMNQLIAQSRDMSETPSQEEYRSTSTTMSEGTVSVSTHVGVSTPEYTVGGKPDWRHLPPDFQRHLDYFIENITHWKYGCHTDFGKFYHTTFISLALQNEALLYAIVGFSAFKGMLKDPNGKIEDFLRYYTHSLTLLRGLLKKQGEAKYDMATLLTILQLATLEVRQFFYSRIASTGHATCAAVDSTRPRINQMVHYLLGK